MALVGFALVQRLIIQPTQPVAFVNGEEISTREFQQRVKLAQRSLQADFQNVQQVAQLFGTDPDSQSFYQQQLFNITQQLANPILIGTAVLEDMIEERLIEEEAASRNIVVSEADVDNAIEESFGFLGDPTAQPAVTGSPSPTAEGTPQPTATPFTREVFENNYDAYLTNLGIFGVKEAALRAEARAALYRQRLEADFESEVSNLQEQVSARHILVAEEDEANDLLERLEDGEDWEALAAEFSLDESNKDQGGDLGWFGRGRMIETFEVAAFAGELNEIVGPIETSFGWHLIEILGHEDRELGEADFAVAVSSALDEWLNTARETAEVEVLSYWADRVPAARLSPGG